MARTDRHMSPQNPDSPVTLSGPRRAIRLRASIRLARQVHVGHVRPLIDPMMGRAALLPLARPAVVDPANPIDKAAHNRRDEEGEKQECKEPPAQ
jgi:hypothetical protein